MNGVFPVEDLRRRLIGKPCWATLAGEGTGSVFHLRLGAKIPTARPLRNKKLSEEVRSNDPEYSLMVYCAWRIDGPTEPITCWAEPNDNEGPMVGGLRQLEGERIEDVQVLPPAWDLEVRFSGQKTLKVFCDSTRHADSYENWFVLGPDDFCLSVEHGCSWTDRCR